MKKRKWRIMKVVISEKHPGFGVLTKGSSSFYSASRHGIIKLHMQARHLEKEIKQKAPKTKEELEKILVGRYIYGKSVDVGDYTAIV